MKRALVLILLSAYWLSAAEPLVGCYTLDREGGDDPAVIAERVVRDVSWLWRGRARARLEKALTPSPTLEIQRDGEAYVIEGNSGRLRIVPGGPEVQRQTPQGEAARVTATIDEGSLVVRIAGERGERMQAFTPTEAGLRVVVTLISDADREPVRVAHHYLGPSPCHRPAPVPSAGTDRDKDNMEE
jgi:hypothetical protein